MTTGSTIHFHGGIGTIGGTKIFVQEDGYRVLFDFGLAYAPGGNFWSDRIEPREGSARLRDYAEFGYVPKLDGIYRPGEAETIGVKPGGDGKTHVFISHLHLDHMAVLDLLADDVPVWMHEESVRLLDALETTGERPGVPAGARAFQWGETISVGPIKVTPVAVDHDIPGAAGLLIESSGGTVVYTGDLRLHGANPERVDAFIAAARAKDPKILLIEGTRLGEPDPTPERPGPLPEPQVPARVVEHLRDCPALGLITLYPRNTPRIGTIAEAVRTLGRTLVLSPETAYIYRAMSGGLSDVAVYRRDRDARALAQGTAQPWLKELLASGVTVVDAPAVRAEQSRYLLQLFHWDMTELVDLKPAPGSVFVHSNGEPLGRFDPAMELWTRWLEHFGLELKFASSTGHASPADLAKVIVGVNPALLMPIHSRTPELMQVEGIRRELPELGAVYEIATGKRVG